MYTWKEYCTFCFIIVRPRRLIVFKSNTYWLSRLVVLLITETEALKSPTINVNLSISSFSSVSFFCLRHFETVIWGIHIYEDVVSSWKNEWCWHASSLIALSPDCSSEMGCGGCPCSAVLALIYSLLFLSSLTHTHSLIGSKNDQQLHIVPANFKTEKWSS